MSHFLARKWLLSGCVGTRGHGSALVPDKPLKANLDSMQPKTLPTTWLHPALPLASPQGIIPLNAGKMAGIFSDIMITELLDLKQLFGRLDPDEIAATCEEAMEVSTWAGGADVVGFARLA